MPSRERGANSVGVGVVGSGFVGGGGVGVCLVHAAVRAKMDACAAGFPLASSPVTSKRWVEKQRRFVAVYDAPAVVPSGRVS